MWNSFSGFAFYYPISPPSRQTRPKKGELKVITIRHHKIVLRGVAHIKLVFWIAFLWKFEHCIPQLLKVFLYWPSKSLCPCVFGWSLWILHSIVIFLTQVFELPSQLSLSSIIHFIFLRDYFVNSRSLNYFVFIMFKYEGFFSFFICLGGSEAGVRLLRPRPQLIISVEADSDTEGPDNLPPKLGRHGPRRAQDGHGSCLTSLCDVRHVTRVMCDVWCDLSDGMC